MLSDLLDLFCVSLCVRVISAGCGVTFAMAVVFDDKLCETWIGECPADCVSSFCASHPPAHAQKSRG